MKTKPIPTLLFCALLSFPSTVLYSNPFPDPSLVPKDSSEFLNRTYPEPRSINVRPQSRDVLRIDVEWSPNESFQLKEARIESSGTPALYERAKNADPLGSYQGTLFSPLGENALAYSAVGTGAEFRTLTRAMTFRFPLPNTVVEFRLKAENPETGIMEQVLSHWINPSHLMRVQLMPDIESKLLREAESDQQLIVNLYAEAYTPDRKEHFWQDAQRVVDALEQKDFPGFANMEFRAIFAPSNTKLGKATNLGMPIPERDSFLGLYFPYWATFGRWYHVIYPTRETRYRDGIGQAPYDYPIMVVHDTQYWGVGNFMEHTAIPSRNGSFTYLLLHELGHFFGLNEEYESGGKTELAFAPKIKEPWSQNITFTTNKSDLKWKAFVDESTPVPTPSHKWTGNGPIGAYRGGYAQTPPLNHSHKPGKNCVMSSRSNFCEVCRKAIEDRVQYDLGNKIY